MKKRMIVMSIFLFFLNEFTYCQSCEENFSKVLELAQDGKINDAIAIAEIALPICKKEFDNKSKDYATIIAFMAWLYNNKGNYSKAEPLYLEASAIQKKILGNEDLDYATSLNALATLYNAQFNFAKAEAVIKEAIAIRKKVLGTQNIEYAFSVNSLATIYSNQGKYFEAEPLCKEALAIRKRILGTTNVDYAISLTNLSVIYSNTGNYSKAELLIKEVADIRKKIFGNENPNYAAALNSLAYLYIQQGKYSSAEPILVEVLSIRKRILGVEHPDYAESINNLAAFYERLGNYPKAEPLYLEALTIMKKALGSDHPNYATLLSNLADLYINQGKYLKVEPLLLEVLDIRKRTLGIDHPDFATSINDLAAFYDLRNLPRAEQLYLEAIEIQKRRLGSENQAYAATLSNLAGFYEEHGDYSKAEKLYLETLSIIKKLLLTGEPDYKRVLNNLTGLNKILGNSKYVSYLSELLTLNEKQIIQQCSFQTTKELSMFLKANSDNYFDSKFSLAYPFNITNGTINYELYNTTILLKNLTLRNSTQVQTKIRESKDSALINTLEEFHNVKKQLNKYAALPKAEQPDEIKDLENKADLIEKKLVTGSQAFKEANEFTNTTWKNVQRSLKKNEAAIEFVSFSYFDKKWTDSTLYAAMVIRPGYTYPKIIFLFEQKQLDSLLKRNNTQEEHSYINQLYSNSDLYNLIVKPIDSLLQGVNTIYAAATGLLYKINLPLVLSNKPDGSRYNVHLLGTTGELPHYATMQLNKTAIQNAYIFGGINYDTSNNSGISFQPPAYTPGFEQVASVTNRGGINSWGYLPGTLSEAMQVGKIDAKAGLKVTVLKGDEASETTFKNLNRLTSPYILHLATHGYFFPDPVKEKPRDFNFLEADKKTVYKWAEDPLLRSGLILAGANKAWKNSSLITDSTEDGILTAMEVANVDLSNCKLAVLSACETGLGDINGSEGIFGLQRGFKLAGVKNIIMSLWKIPDTQSAELLTLFYENCFSGLSVYESLKQAQLTMSKKYPPYYWAGFVLLE